MCFFSARAGLGVYVCVDVCVGVYVWVCSCVYMFSTLIVDLVV